MQNILLNKFYETIINYSKNGIWLDYLTIKNFIDKTQYNGLTWLFELTCRNPEGGFDRIALTEACEQKLQQIVASNSDKLNSVSDYIVKLCDKKNFFNDTFHIKVKSTNFAFNGKLCENAPEHIDFSYNLGLDVTSYVNLINTVITDPGLIPIFTMIGT